MSVAACQVGDMQLTKANEAWYLIVFFTLSAIGLTLALIHEVGDKTSDDLVSTILSVVRQMDVVVVVAGASAFAGVEGYNMLAERYARREREIGRRQGREEGREEILAVLDPEMREKVERKLKQNGKDSRGRG